MCECAPVCVCICDCITPPIKPCKPCEHQIILILLTYLAHRRIDDLDAVARLDGSTGVLVERVVGGLEFAGRRLERLVYDGAVPVKSGSLHEEERGEEKGEEKGDKGGEERGEASTV